MKKTLLFLTIFAVLAVIGIISLPYVLDINNYKEQLSKVVKDNTGADINISGKIELEVFPDIAIVLNDVSIDEGRFASIEKLIVDLKIIPLFKGMAEVSSLEVISPSINLVVSKNGEKSWGFSQNKAGDKDVAENSDNSEKAANKSDAPYIQLKKIKISNAKIIYKNEQENSKFLLDGLNFNSSFLEGYNDFRINGKVLLGQPNGEEFSVTGSYQISGKKYSVKDLDFKLGSESGNADFSGDFTNLIPDIDISFNVSALDFNKYLQKNVVPTLAETDSNASRRSEQQEVFSWSKTPFNFDVIRKYNINLSVKVGRVKYNELELDRVLFNIHTLNGKLIFNLKDLALYNGGVTGQLVLDTTTKLPSLNFDTKIENINVTKITGDMALFSYFDGTLNSNIKLSSHGSSEAEVINNLEGTGDLSVSSGQIKGLDLFSMIGNITNAFNFKKNTASATEFASLTGTFKVEDGVLDNQDMLLKSKIIDFEGKGQSDLSRLNIKYKVIPKIKSDSYEENRLNIKVPVIIEGSLFSPVFRPDLVNPLKQLIRDPEAAGNLIKQIQKDFKGLKGLGNNKGGNDGTEKPKIQIPDEIKDILNAF